MKISVIFLFLTAAFLTVPSFAQDGERPGDYPIPPYSEEQLFFIQRNRNKHTIIYDAKLNSDGTLNNSEPIDVYWLRYYSAGTEKRELKWIEQKFAYGYSSERIDNRDEYWIELSAFNGRKIHLINKPGKQPFATVMINDRKCKLDYIWVFADESGAWPKVIHVDIFGTDLVTGEKQRERIPNR